MGTNRTHWTSHVDPPISQGAETLKTLIVTPIRTARRCFVQRAHKQCTMYPTPSSSALNMSTWNIMHMHPHPHPHECIVLHGVAALIKKMAVKGNGYRGQNEWHRSRSSVKVNNISQNFAYHILKYPCEVSSRSYRQFHQKICAKIYFWFGQEKNSRRNSFTDVDTLWWKLHHDRATWCKSDQTWFEDLSLNFIWHKLGLNTFWADMQIEPLKLYLQSAWTAIE